MSDPSSPGADPNHADFLESMLSAPPAEARRLLSGFVRAELADFLGFSSGDEVGLRDNAIDLGIDSLQAVDFKLRLEQRLLCSLRSTLLFDYPTPEALVDFLFDEVLALGSRSGPSRVTAATAPAASIVETPAAWDQLSERELRILVARQHARLERLERARSEPIAVVGIGCRLPGGARSPATFWRLLAGGVDAIREVPPERWSLDELYDPTRPRAGKMYCRSGGFLAERIDEFDAGFFSISPREATQLDPQQRVLLEVAWETLENGGISPAELFGTSAGVFIGLRESEYFNSQSSRTPEEAESYYGTGNALSTAAGRISFTLGLTGPCVSIDTACSSSLVALHQAVQSLRRGECDSALAGGVSLILDPISNVGLSQASMLAADGRCKTFDARADGYGRSEGCGMVYLKPLSLARRDGDPILALIRGTAVNQDGASGGLTVPNGPAQQDVIRRALKDAGMSPYEVGYIEAHGTGTSLGDPIEIGALDAVFGDSRLHDQPLVVGSVKTNIGHLETGAGVAGLLKVILALQHEAIPPHLHLESRNPHIDWDASVVKVPVDGVDWRRGATERVAGVSSFGFSGTNAHAVVSEAEPPPVGSPEGRPVEVLPLSAASAPALAELAARTGELWSRSEGDSALRRDLCFTAGAGRAHLPHRLAILVRPDRPEPLEPDGPAAVTGVARGEPPRVAFLFTGQGSQYAGMGRAFDEHEPVFREALDRCGMALDPVLEAPLRDVLFGAAAERIDQTELTQPALFAVELALAELLRAGGVRPDWVLGHSVGEYAAAVLAGVLGLEDAARLVAARGRLMKERTEPGAMRAVFADRETVQERIGSRADRVSIAAENGPETLVISGASDAVEAIARDLEARGVETRPLVVSRAFHSPLMDPMLAEFEAVARSIRYREPETGFVSALTGERVTSEIASAEYWVRHVRAPVRFHAGMLALEREEPEVYVEVGPKPVLLGMARRFVSRPCAWLPTGRDGDDAGEALSRAIAELYVRGAPIDWRGLHRGRPRRKLPATLPTYPFQRERYWLKRRPAAAPARASLHPLLGASAPTPRLEAGERQFESRLSTEGPCDLVQHRVFETPIAPGAAWAELAIAAARQVGIADTVAVRDLTFQSPLPLTERPTPLFLLLAAPDDAGARSFRVTSLGEGEAWTQHATGRLQAGVVDGKDGPDLASLRERVTESVDVEEFYAAYHEVGLDYGPAFRGVRDLWRGEDEALCRIELPDATAGADECALHPALLDACFQSCGAFLMSRRTGTTYLPLGLDELVLRHAPGGRGFCHSVLRASDETDDASHGTRPLIVDLRLFDADGRLAATMRGLRLVPATASSLLKGRGVLYAERWRRDDSGSIVEDAVEPRRYVVLADRGGLGARLAPALEERGAAEVALVESTPRHPNNGRDHAARVQALARRLEQIGVGQGVVYAWGLDRIGEDPGSPETQRALAADFLIAVQALVQVSGREGALPPRLWLLTCAAKPVPPPSGAVRETAQAALWGLGATLALEHPELRTTLIDFDPTEDAATEGLAREIASDGPETRVAWRGGERFVARLEPLGERADGRLERPSGPVSLRIAEYGLDHLRLAPLSRRPPGPGELEVEVEAGSLNLKDVLYALGLLREFGRTRGYSEPSDQRFGLECVGRVVRVGAGVDDVAVGDEVLASVDGSLQSYVTVRRSMVAPKPRGLDAVDAAALQTAFLTALYGLERRGEISAGDTILIHAAAGGVGQAACQVARRAGARVLATASHGKHDLLRRQGIEEVFDSRSLDFAQAVLDATDGRGVDIVLNSLKGEFIDKSMECLAEGGRFVEIGKIDAWTEEEAAARRPDVRFHRFDMDEVFEEEPGLFAALHRDLRAGFEQGSLRPLPVRAFALEEAADAFQCLARARTVGKLVIRMAPGFAAPGAGRSCLVTGGLGALGIHVARWLVERGARHVVLCGRRPPGDAARAAIEELAAGGVASAPRDARVEAVAVDVTDREALRELLDSLDAAGTPIGGIVHAAGVLDDGMLQNLEPSRFDTVLGPKAQGAWNLHVLTRDRPLDFFVSYSSMVSILGSPGQGSYAAGNAYLDGLAHERRAHGLPAVSIQWGPWSGDGMAARLENKNRARFEAMGLSHIDPDAGASALERILDSGAVEAAVLPIRWARFLAQIPGAPPPFLEALRDAGLSAAAPPAEVDDRVLASVRAAAESERPEILLALATRQLEQVLGFTSGQALDPELPFVDLGVDSLLAVDLRNRLEANLKCSLSATVVFDHPTLGELVTHLCERLSGGGDGAAARDDEEEALIREIESMSDEEAERLLALEEEDG